MSRRGVQICSACSHTDRASIDEGLRVKRPLSALSVTFGLAPAILSRHRAHIVGPLLPETAKSEDNELLQAIDSLIEELRALNRRAKRNRDAATSCELTLKICRELRAWFQLRVQLAARQPARPIERSEVELPDEQLKSMAEVYLRRGGKVGNEAA